VSSAESPQSLEQEVRRFVVENFLFGEDDGSLKLEDSFLDSGVIDSTGVLELVTFLEQQYEIKINDTELVPDNLDSISRVSSFIRRKQNGHG
jgi:acyl carrier protein